MSHLRTDIEIMFCSIKKKKIFLQQGSSSSAGILQLNLNGK